jgi:hypothetical protein
MASEYLTLKRDRFPADLQVGHEFRICVKVMVRKIEAEEIDISGFDEFQQIAHGETDVESSVLRVLAIGTS